jgi:F-type H+-transporting ATPase subunit b
MTVDWWTLGLQAVNVLILIWLLQRLFWRPVAAAIARRQSESQALLDAANSEKAAVEAARADIEKTRQGFAAERAAVIVNATTEAEKTKAAILATARSEAEALRQAAETQIAHQSEVAAKERSEQLMALAVEIAGRLAGRLEGPTVEAAFLDWLASGIAAMSPDSKREVTGQGTTLQLVSSSELAPEAQARIAARITAAFGARPTLTFATDPALIAGFELHSPHFTLRNSWRADLDRIATELRNGG